MVNKKISQLEEKTDLLLDDEFPFIRKQGNEYINYKVKKSNICSKLTLELNNVDNTSDLNKPISTATQTAINSLNNTALAYSIALG
jgi:hypothetical protein